MTPPSAAVLFCYICFCFNKKEDYSHEREEKNMPGSQSEEQLLEVLQNFTLQHSKCICHFVLVRKGQSYIFFFLSFCFLMQTIVLMILQSSACVCQGIFCCPTNEKLGVHEELEEITTRTADVNWPEGYPIQYSVMLSKKTQGNL